MKLKKVYVLLPKNGDVNDYIFFNSMENLSVNLLDNIYGKFVTDFLQNIKVNIIFLETFGLKFYCLYFLRS